MYYWIKTIPLFFALCFFASCKKTNDTKEPKITNYSLIIERGAFHYDSFKLTKDELHFYPSEIDSTSQDKYRTASKIKIDTLKSLAFFKELEERGIWDLKKHYTEETSCTSVLRIIYRVDKKETTIECDDYKRGCPELIQAIEQKIIALEGNDLKRIYLPG